MISSERDRGSAGALRTVVRAAVLPLVVLALGSDASAQLTPERTYYGIGRTIPMSVQIPDDLKASGEAVVQLLTPATGEVRATASVVPGLIDMAGLFPALWDVKAPPARHGAQYAQLLVGQRKIGAPVVLQLLTDPETCVLDPQTQTPVFRSGRAGCSGLRAWVDKQVVMDTTLGTIQFALRPDEAPNTVWNFMELCRGGFYTDVCIHRVAALNPGNQKPFVIQAGDPIFGHGAGLCEGGPGYRIDLEKSALPHDFGVISMARDPKVPDSAGSHFFICLSREGTSHLDGQFAAFGRAVAGADVIQRIAAVAVDKDGHPREPVVIKSCRLVDAPPFGEGPGPALPQAARPVDR